MSIFPPEGPIEKTASNLTVMAFMNSTSKYVKQGPVPVGQYQHQRNLQGNERYGSSRRLIRRDKKDGEGISVNSQQKGVSDSASLVSSNVKDRQVEGRDGLSSKNSVASEVVSIQRQIITERKESNTPQVQKIGYQRIQKNAQTPKNQSTTSQQSKIGMLDIFDTPKTQTGRYGANRKVQTQKTEQFTASLEDEKIKLSTEITEPEPQTTIYKQEVKRIDRTASEIVTPNTKPSLQVINTQDQGQSVSVLQTPTNNKESKPFSRSNTNSRVQKIVTPATKKQQVVEQQASKTINRSKIILFVLKNVSQAKLGNYFKLLREGSLKIKKKNEAFARLLAAKSLSVHNLTKEGLYRLAFTKITKHSSTPQILKSNKPQSLNDNKKILASTLHRLFSFHLTQVLRKIAYNKLKNAKADSLFASLTQLYRNKINTTFQRTKEYATSSVTNKRVIMGNMCSISRKVKGKTMELAFRKILLVRKVQQKQQPTTKNEKGSPIYQFDKELTPQSTPQKSGKQKKIIQKLQASLKQKTAKLQTLQQELSIQKQEAQKKIQSLKIWCQQLVQQNEERKRVNDQLKQKAMSIQFLEQEYIETPDLLLDTKFPILYEAYIKIEKLGSDEVKMNNLLTLFPEWADQISKNDQLKKWIEMRKNLELKKEVSRYEGQSELVRKAAKIANEESKLLVGMIRGYIKQRFTWEWVKTALSNISHT